MKYLETNLINCFLKISPTHKLPASSVQQKYPWALAGWRSCLECCPACQKAVGSVLGSSGHAGEKTA